MNKWMNVWMNQWIYKWVSITYQLDASASDRRWKQSSRNEARPQEARSSCASEEAFNTCFLYNLFERRYGTRSLIPQIESTGEFYKHSVLEERYVIWKKIQKFKQTLSIRVHWGSVCRIKLRSFFCFELMKSRILLISGNYWLDELNGDISCHSHENKAWAKRGKIISS